MPSDIHFSYLIRTYLDTRSSHVSTQGDYDRAIECYTTGINLDAENAVLLANRAMALLKQDKYGAAEADCHAALEIDPSYVKALMRRGSARVNLNKLDEAKTDFDDVLFLEPNNKQVMTLVFIEIACLLVQQRFSSSVWIPITSLSLSRFRLIRNW